jgi:hypothetical protein
MADRWPLACRLAGSFQQVGGVSCPCGRLLDPKDSTYRFPLAMVDLATGAHLAIIAR